jgi:transposase
VSAGKVDAKVPGRTREQRLRALRLANEVRSARAQLKKDLASGKIELAEILARPPEWVRTARVRDVLLALPKIGSVKAGRILADCGIAPSKTLGGLTDRQRAELLKRFRRNGHDK